MNDSIAKYINKKDFPAFGFQLFIRNETSHTHFSKPDQIHLIELKEQGLVIELPQNICQKGHSLTLFFIDQKVEMNKRVPDSGPVKEASFTGIAKVIQIDSADIENRTVTAELQFTQHEAELWRKILEKFSEKQEGLNKQIMSQHAVRGDE